MNIDIKNWCVKICKKYDLRCFYLPKTNSFVLHKEGRAVQHFNETQFYQKPKMVREKEMTPLVKLGLVHNLDERVKNQLFLNRKLGKLIY